MMDKINNDMAGKIKYRNLNDKQRKQYLGDFYSIIGSLQGYDEAKNFFKDLLTPSEVVMIARRIQIAKLLTKGWTHEEIRQNLGAGLNTIAQVDKWLNEGFGGYGRVLKKLEAKQKAQAKQVPPSPYSLDDVRRRYPAHFALLNLIMDKK